MKKAVYVICVLLGMGGSLQGNSQTVSDPASFTAPRFVAYHGLDELSAPGVRPSLDDWTSGFSSRAAVSVPDQEKLLEFILESYHASKSLPDFYRRVLKGPGKPAQPLNREYNRAEDYSALASGLLAARRELRPAQAWDGAVTDIAPKRKAALLLLETLAEETLYVGAVKFPGGFPKAGDTVFSSIYNQISPEVCSIDGKTKTAILHGITLCQGDVLISKGPALSSSLLARVTAYPGNFSHATAVYVSNDPTKPAFQLPEAEMEDGVKLRDPKSEYVDGRKRKLFVYRIRATTTHEQNDKVLQLIKGTASFKTSMDQLTGDKPETVTSFHYGFKFDPDDTEKLFCSAVVRDIGKRADLTENWNPYSNLLYSTVLDPEGDPQGIVSDLFTMGLGVPNLSFPAPSDIELNPNYELVALQVDASTLSADRVDVAILDALFAYLKANADVIRTRYLDAVKDIGNDPLTQEDVDKFRQLGLVDDKYLDAFKTRLPDGANVKQIVFFGLLDMVLGKDRDPSKTESGQSFRIQLQDAVARAGRPIPLGALREMTLHYVDQAEKGAAANPMISEQLGAFLSKLDAVRSLKTARKAPKR